MAAGPGERGDGPGQPCEQRRQAAAAAEAQVALRRRSTVSWPAGRPRPRKWPQSARSTWPSAAVKQAQAAYDRVKGDPDIAARPEALALEQATVRFNSAKAALRGGHPGRDTAATGRRPGPGDGCPGAGPGGRRPGAVRRKPVCRRPRPRWRAPRPRLQALKAGPTAEDKALAEVPGAFGAGTLAAAQAQLAQTQVLAPFAGQIGTVSVRPGELAVPGQPVADARRHRAAARGDHRPARDRRRRV